MWRGRGEEKNEAEADEAGTRRGGRGRIDKAARNFLTLAKVGGLARLYGKELRGNRAEGRRLG